MTKIRRLVLIILFLASIFQVASTLAEMIVDTVWVRRYNGQSNSYDNAMAFEVDDSGSIYVTGWNDGGSTNDDYLSVKYFQALRGDVNSDLVIDIGDVVYLINYLYNSDHAPVPVLKVGDCNCEGVVDVGDVVYLINYLFKGGPSPDC
jgi:hypothetical protein